MPQWTTDVLRRGSAAAVTALRPACSRAPCSGLRASVSASAESASGAAPIPDQLERVAAQHGFELDPAQERVASAFQRLADELGDNGGVLDRLLGRRRPVRGIYLWGAVGRGKSFLMDEFFRLAPLEAQAPSAFPPLHAGASTISSRELQGQAGSAAAHRASAWREDTRLLCLDEFHVTDIGDAMLMRGLLDGLFEHGIVAGDDLQPAPRRALRARAAARAVRARDRAAQAAHRSHRARRRAGLPAAHSGARRRVSLPARRGSARAACSRLSKAWQERQGEGDVALEIEGRAIRALRLAPGTAWFDFAELCDGPRGTADYIELARRYHTVLLSGVRQFAPAHGARACDASPGWSTSSTIATSS